MLENARRLTTVSACMMIKNEERNLDRCLSSILPLVDEIIVVDTGSSDNSISIAQKYGAKVFVHPWENNFSLHRNQSLSYATSDWVFVIDADEEVIKLDETVNALKLWLTELDERIVACPITLDDMQKGVVAMSFNTGRFFRRGVVHYEGIVHNQPVIPDNTEGAFCPIIKLKHYGYDLTPEQAEAKEKRTLSLLRERLAKDSHDFDAMFYLMQAHSTKGEFKIACDFAEMYLANKDKIKYFNNCIYFPVIHNYMKMEKIEDAKRWLDLAVEAIPDDLDINMALVEYGLIVDDFRAIMTGARTYLGLYKKHSENVALRGNRFSYTYNPMGLSFILFNLAISQMKDGMKLIKMLETVLPETPKPYMEGIMLQLKDGLGEFGIKSKMMLQNKDGSIEEIGALQQLQKNSIEQMNGGD